MAQVFCLNDNAKRAFWAFAAPQLTDKHGGLQNRVKFELDNRPRSDGSPVKVSSNLQNMSSNCPE